ncbi:flagellar brake protein [Cognatilysobacter segetis]|uniref:flagellar brake protein n=1 Tax=Cognatilysobacter segetis TaxID=2492394 RepID=UPI00106062DC|nr:flagellar brake protein [Lysobacter segetis]
MTEARTAEGDGMYEKYMLHHPADIRGCLKQLVEKHCVLLVHAAGTENAVSVALAVGPGSLWIDVPRDAALTAQLLAADRLRFESSIDRITVRFATGAAREASHDGLPALEVPLPVKVMHLQRREYVRREPLGTISCLLPTHADGGARRTIRAGIADIGGGGLAVLTSDDSSLDLKSGDLFPDVTLELPDQEPMTVTLRVQHAQKVDQHGRRVWRAGCSFVDLTVGDQARLLRYVMQLDRLHMAKMREF